MKTHDVKGFLEARLNQHKALGLPPFSTVGKIVFQHRDKAQAFAEAFGTYKMLEQKLSETKEAEFEVNWAPAFFPRAHNQYWFHVFITGPNKTKLVEFITSLNLESQAKIDINPSSLL